MATLNASMAGTVFRLLVETGQSVAVGDEVIILESMKMEIPVTAEQAGKVSAVHVGEGDFVNEGDSLIDVELA